MASRHPELRIADLSGAGIPMYERLRASFAGRFDADEDIATFVTDLLQRSDGALFHVWALRKLDWQFSERRARRCRLHRWGRSLRCGALIARLSPKRYAS
jgi:hypothetical protein